LAALSFFCFTTDQSCYFQGKKLAQKCRLNHPYDALPLSRGR